MIIRLPERTVEVFTTSPRTLDLELHWRNKMNVVRWSEQYGCTGVLIFTGNDTYVEPWITAHTVLLATEKLCPLVAVNPVYMHPYTAAKMVSSFAYLYRRRVFLNMVAGTALNYLDSLGDEMSHDERYERLEEYITIIKSLTGGGRLTTQAGKFYKVSNLNLMPRVPASLRPGFLLAGQSEAARRVARSVDAVSMQMLPPTLAEGLSDASGIHFGVITRESEGQAWEAARALFPEDKEGQEVLELSMKNTDSVWKRRMMMSAGAMGGGESPGYWLDPFRNFKADCPYFVGDYERVADVLRRLVENGIGVFILDIPAREEEFRHIAVAFDKAGRQLTEGAGGAGRAAR